MTVCILQGQLWCACSAVPLMAEHIQKDQLQDLIEAGPILGLIQTHRARKRCF